MVTSAVIAFWVALLGIVIALGAGAASSSIGQGLAAADGIESSSRQLLARSPVFRTFIIGMAFIESGAILSVIVAAMVLMSLRGATISLLEGIVYLGATAGIGISAMIVGIGSGYLIRSAMRAIARQPLEGNRIFSVMLLSQALLETPVILSFVLSVITFTQATSVTDLSGAFQLFFACLIMAFGSIGGVTGQAKFASAVCEALGKNIQGIGFVLPFTFITQALIETSIILNLVLSIFFIMAIKASLPIMIAIGIGCLSAMTFGGIGAGVGSSIVASSAVGGMARGGETAAVLFRNAFLSQMFVDTALIYSFIISFIIVRDYFLL